MGVYRVGEVIKKTRESIGMTQEELCEGICTVETISRIENGKTIPSRRNFEDLMEKMGRTGKKYLPFIRGNDMETHLMRDKLVVLISTHRYEEIPLLLEKFEEKLDLEDAVNRQFVLRIRALTEYNLGHINEVEKRAMLEEALMLTVPKYCDGTLPKGVFTRNELMIFGNIASSYAEEGNLEKAIAMLRPMEEYFQSVHIGTMEKSISEAFLLSSLAQYLSRAGKYEESRAMQEKLKDEDIRMRQASNLSQLLYRIAYNNEKLGINEKDCKEKLIQAYYVARLCKNEVMMKHIRKHVKQIYKDDFLEYI
ncbi:MAG: helix-turn-helix transcriptional regulator [bacterium]|nr:helix-turn-helix transcriptional regulator [bacterium]